MEEDDMTFEEWWETKDIFALQAIEDDNEYEKALAKKAWEAGYEQCAIEFETEATDEDLEEMFGDDFEEER
jgi:hypothetical protein